MRILPPSRLRQTRLELAAMTVLHDAVVAQRDLISTQLADALVENARLRMRLTDWIRTTPPLDTPGLVPAPRPTLPNSDPVLCGTCGEPMPWGHGALLRPRRRIPKGSSRVTLSFTRAVKKALKARIALEGPSGSGKTYTALTLATALGKRIALIDTEHRSASLYADLFEFDTLELDDNYHPERLIEALAAAGAAGYDVVIVDSWSHFWMGSGGMLEQVDAAGKRSGGGNNFAGWKEMKPLERRMVDAMLAYPGHLITTLRVKTDYVVETNDRGKQAPRKVGLKAEQRDGLEYEFTLVASLDIDNTLVVTKSRCPALSGAVVARPTGEFGATLAAWLDAGETGPTAVQLRDEILADPSMDRTGFLSIYNRAKAAGLLAAPIVDGTGDTKTLGDFIVDTGKEAQKNSALDRLARTAPAPAEQPSPAAAVDVDQLDERRAKRLHVLLGRIGVTDRDVKLDYLTKALGRVISTSAELTAAECDALFPVLEAEAKAMRDREGVR